ncbi:MAG: SAVED domain-containing protein [Rhodothermia bacterium]|nr:SAVED domain-containing protein [Rhodothermia bacterium]
MSKKQPRPPIPEPTQRKLWAKAAGMCQFDSCNEILYRDNLTRKESNLAKISHIVAFSPDGPRGDIVKSPLLAKDINNLMLTCGVHAKIIDDNDKVKDYPEDLLLKYKREHEERVRRIASIKNDHKTHVLVVGFNILERAGVIDINQVHEAINQNGHYPDSDEPTIIDINACVLRDDNATYWAKNTEQIQSDVYNLIKRGNKGNSYTHLSIFGLAPIPLLMYLGKQIGDIITVEVFNRHRIVENWLWQNMEDESDFQYDVHKPILDRNTKSVALNLSLSNTIHQSEIAQKIGSIPTYTITIPSPNRTFLKSKLRLEKFKEVFHMVLSEIRSSCADDCKIHLFPAVPVAVAVECGRIILPKADKEIIVYDWSESNKVFFEGVTL